MREVVSREKPAKKVTLGARRGGINALVKVAKAMLALTAVDKERLRGRPEER